MSRFAELMIVVAVMSSFGAELRADEIAGAIKARRDDARRAAMVETTLAAWLRAAKECRSYDAKFTRWNYDLVFGDATKPTKIAQGRFLFQRGGLSRLDAAADDESVLWQNDEISLIDWKLKTHRLYGPLTSTAVKQPQVEQPLKEIGFFESIQRALAVHFAEIGVVPHLLSTDHKQFRADYDFYLTEWSPDKLVLTAEPKSGAKPAPVFFDRLEYAFTDGLPLPYAVRVTAGRHKTVYQLHDPLINKPAPDTEAFVKPDLSGLRQIDHRDAPTKPR